MTTPLMLSPLNAVSEKLGAHWLEVAGWRCVDDYGNPAAEVAALRAGAGLADISQLGKIQIEGQTAAALLSAVLGAAPQAVGAPDVVGGHTRLPAGDLYCLRPDMFFLSVRPGTETSVVAALAAAPPPGLVTVTDLTHGLAAIEIVGPRAVDVLTRVCGLDFSPSAFPSPSAQQSSVAKTRQIIIRQDRDLPSFTLFGARSLAAYVWGVLLNAGRPFGLAPVGLEALSSLEAA